MRAHVTHRAMTAAAGEHSREKRIEIGDFEDRHRRAWRGTERFAWTRERERRFTRIELRPLRAIAEFLFDAERALEEVKLLFEIRRDEENLTQPLDARSAHWSPTIWRSIIRDPEIAPTKSRDLAIAHTHEPNVGADARPR